MAEQSYESHRHNPKPTTLAFFLWLAAVVGFGGAHLGGWATQGLAMAALLGSVLVIIAMGRTYTTRLQDRIILLEMKVRCAEVLPAGEDAKLASLSKDQVVALRFASDGELSGLLDRAVRERLSPDDIKKAITQWKPDPYRT